MTFLSRLVGWRADAAAALLGLAAALALPPLHALPLIWLALPGLLALIDAAPRARVAARRGFVFALFHHMAGVYWVTSAVLVRAAEFWWAVPVAVPLLAAVLALFVAVPCGLARVAPAGWRRVALLAGLWVLGDIARQFVLSGFPWNPLGSVWELPGWLGDALIQPAAWVGVGGLTFLTLWIGAAPAFGARGTLAGAAGLAVWLALGATRLAAPAPAAPGLTAILVQGNVPEAEHLVHYQDPAWARAIFDRHLALTAAGMARVEGPAVVVWPETASPYWLEQDPVARRAVARAAGGAPVLAGSPRESAPRVAHNSLVAIRPDGGVGATYDKHHLVPYGEYFPSYLPIRLGEQGWTPGPGNRTLHIPGLPAIGPLICYEAIFPAQVVVAADRPALLVNITNDSWFGDSAGPRQHLAAARMRAVEEGLPMLRAANTGISAVIDAHGRVLARLGLDRQGTLVSAVPGPLPPTPASRMGLAAPALLALASCAAALGLTGRRNRPAQNA